MTNDTTRKVDCDYCGRPLSEHHDPTGCHPSDDGRITSLQRELAEARAALDEIRFARQEYATGGLRPIGLLDTIDRVLAPAPSDVKGEEPAQGDWTFDKANACIRGIGVALGIDKPDVTPFGIGLGILAAIEALKSRASLTPLTDPSVRGVLVDASPDDVTNGAMMDGIVFRSRLASDKFVKAVPASEFVVPARGEPGLKPLDKRFVALLYFKGEPTRDVFPGVLWGRFNKDGKLDVLNANKSFQCDEPVQPIGLVSPTLYGTADQSERIKELEEVRVSLIGDRAELYEEWRIASAELDRLRSAIEEHRHRNTGMACDHKKSDLDLWSALAQPGDVKQEKRESLTVPVLDENGAAIGSAKLRTIERGTVAEVTLSKDTAEQIGLSQPGDGEGRTEGELLAQSEADIAAGRLHNHDDVKRELLAAPAAAGDEAEGEPLVDFFVRHINEARDVADEWMARAIDAREKQRAAEKQLDELRHKHMTPDERVAHMKELFVAFDEAAKVAEKSVASIKEHDQKRASERDQLRKRAEDAEANVRKLAPRVESLEADMADLRELWRHLCNSNDTEERESCEKAIHEILENKPSGIRRLDDTTSAASG